MLHQKISAFNSAGTDPKGPKKPADFFKENIILSILQRQSNYVSIIHWREYNQGDHATSSFPCDGSELVLKYTWQETHEKAFQSAFQQHLANYENRSDCRIAEVYLQHSTEALADPVHYLGNPVNAFQLLERLVIHWEKDAVPVLTAQVWKDYEREMELINKKLPTTHDLVGAVAALKRLQDTYQLNVSSIALGNFGGGVSSVMSGQECATLGIMFYLNGDFYHAALWIEEALNLLGNDAHTGRADLLDRLGFAYFKLGYVKHALKLTKDLLKLKPGNERARKNKRNYENILAKKGDKLPNSTEVPVLKPPLGRQDEEGKDYRDYEASCRGEGEATQKIKDRQKLKCRYIHNNNPLLFIQPAKEEELHLDPWIAMYHDLLSEKEINDIKLKSFPILFRALVWNHHKKIEDASPVRIGKSAWLNESYFPKVEEYRHKIQAITGLGLETAEPLQVVNYGIGGQYEPHYDFSRTVDDAEPDELNTDNTGNRIATFLMYLSNVEAGGDTVFPRIGLKVSPQKGAAIFWYNLHKNGEGLLKTIHAACPVLLGDKWIATVWFHERGQEFRRPCSRNPDD